LSASEWKDDKPNGHGTETRPDDWKYVGEFRDGMFNGQGTFTMPHGYKRVGEWRDGHQNGRGTLTRRTGEATAVTWVPRVRILRLCLSLNGDRPT